MIAVQEWLGCMSLPQGRQYLALAGGEQSTLRKLLNDFLRPRLNIPVCMFGNLDSHLQRLLKEYQVLLCIVDSKLAGCVGWVWVDEMYAINKGIFYTPDNINNGKALQVTLAALDKQADIYGVIRYFRAETKLRGATQVCWGHRKRNRFIRRSLLK